MHYATEMTALDIWNNLQRDQNQQQSIRSVDQTPEENLCKADRLGREEITWEICKKLPTYINEQGIVKATAVKKMMGEIHEWAKQNTPAPPKRHNIDRWVKAILSSLNALPGLTIMLPTEPVIMPRPSHAPSSVEEVQGLRAMLLIDKYIDQWRQNSRHRDRWLLTLAVRMSCRLGMGQEVVLGTLSMLGTRHIEISNRKIRLPAQLIDEGIVNQADPRSDSSQRKFKHKEQKSIQLDPAYQPMGYYTLTLPRGVLDPLRHLLHEASGNKKEWLALESPAKDVPTLKTRQTQLRKRLDAATKAMIKDMKDQQPEHQTTLAYVSGWSRLVKSGPLVAHRKGIPSVWLDILSRYPLPTDSREPIILGSDFGRYAPSGQASRHHKPEDNGSDGLDDDLYSPTSSGTSSLPQPDDLSVTLPGGYEGVTDPLSIDQSYALRHTVKAFSRALQTLTTGRRLSGKVYREPLHQLRHEFIEKLTNITGTEDSFGHWVVSFACSRLVKDGDTISSVKTYLSRLMPDPLLLNDAIVDVPSWDQDTVDELCDEAQSFHRWGYNTRQHFMRTMGMFVHFCQDYGILDDVTPPSSSEARLTTRRTRIINPVQMDQAWRSLVGHSHPSQANIQFSLALALGYYGGLRASEVCQLTLRDVRVEHRDKDSEFSEFHHHFSHGRSTSNETESLDIIECWIYIRYGKTPAARRRIPLHVLAPPEVIILMENWWKSRRDVAPAYSLKDIGFFGPLFSPQAYSRQGLIDPLLSWLRVRWGDGVDFHGLRHSAASWWQVRLHAAQHDDFRDSLHYRFHWMLDPQSLDRFLTYLCGPEGDESIEKGTLIGQLAKLIGHRHVNTLLKTYSHSLGLIHSHVLNTTWSRRKKKGNYSAPVG